MGAKEDYLLSSQRQQLRMEHKITACATSGLMNCCFSIVAETQYPHIPSSLPAAYPLAGANLEVPADRIVLEQGQQEHPESGASVTWVGGAS
jgi:hypothetical protein